MLLLDAILITDTNVNVHKQPHHDTEQSITV